MKTEKLGQPAAATPQGAHVIPMQLDARAVEYVIYSLKNLYTDPLFAAFREYLANAIDANERAGSQQPVAIEVTDAVVNGKDPATWIMPVLRIRDHGAGMDEGDLANYASYGFSDKRDSNAERGGYGYGGKSALAFTNQFRIVSVKDGLRYDVVVHAEFKQAGFFEILSIEATAEPSGVLIEIPLTVAEAERLRDPSAVAKQLRGYPGTAVLFNGRVPQESIHDTEQFLAVEEPAGVLGWVGLTTATRHRGGFASWSQAKIVIGGIVYDLPTPPGLEQDEIGGLRYLSSLRTRYLEAVSPSNSTFYFNFPIGSLELIPSRDSIQYNAENITVLQEGIEKFFNQLPHAAFQRLQACASPVTAINFAYNNWGFFVPAGAPGQPMKLRTAWRGRPITHTVQQPGDAAWALVTSYVGQGVHRVEVDADVFPLYQLVLQGLGAHTYQDRKTIIVRVPAVSEEVLLEVEKKAREYGQFVWGTDYLETYVTDTDSVEFWTEALIPRIDFTVFQAQVKAARAAKRAQVVPMANQRVLRYPVTVPGVTAKFERQAATTLPQNIIYMPADWFPEGDSFSSSFWFYAKTPQSYSGYNDRFAAALTAVVGDNAPVLVIPPGRSVSNFLRYAPAGRMFIDLLVARINAIMAGDADTAAVYAETVRVFQQAEARHDRVYVDFRFMSTVLHYERDDIRLMNTLYRGVVTGFEDTTPTHMLAELSVNMQAPLRVQQGLDARVKNLLQPHVRGHQKRGLAGDIAVFDRTLAGQMHAGDAHRIIRALNAYAPGITAQA